MYNFEFADIIEKRDLLILPCSGRSEQRALAGLHRSRDSDIRDTGEQRGKGVIADENFCCHALPLKRETEFDAGLIPAFAGLILACLVQFDARAHHGKVTVQPETPWVCVC